MSWWIIGTMALITFFNRYVFFIRAFQFRFSPKFERFLSFSAFAVLTAIWTPIVVEYQPQSGFQTAENEYLIGCVVAALLTMCRVPTLLVVGVSMAVFWGLRFG